MQYLKILSLNFDNYLRFVACFLGIDVEAPFRTTSSYHDLLQAIEISNQTQIDSENLIFFSMTTVVGTRPEFGAVIGETG